MRVIATDEEIAAAEASRGTSEPTTIRSLMREALEEGPRAMEDVVLWVQLRHHRLTARVELVLVYGVCTPKHVVARQLPHPHTAPKA